MAAASRNWGPTPSSWERRWSARKTRPLRYGISCWKPYHRNGKRREANGNEDRPEGLGNPEDLVQHHGRHAQPAGARPAPGHREAGHPGRPAPALPDGAHRAGGVGPAAHPDPGGGPEDLRAVEADPAGPGDPARAGDRA